MKAYFYKSAIISLILAIALNGYGQDKKIQKTYHWNYEVNEDVRFKFNNYDCDLTIHTWDKPEIKYSMSVDATLKSVEDAKRLDRYIDNLEYTHSAGMVEFNNRFWINRKNIMGKKTLDLKGEKKIGYTEFKMNGELWIPKSCNLFLESKYSGIDLEDINGRLYLNLYNDKLYGGNVNAHCEIESKYSNLEFKQMKDVDADLYNTDIETGDIGNLTIQSKYSSFRAGNVGVVNIDAYNDKYFFGNTGSIKFIDKYSDLTAGYIGNMNTDCYNSTIILTGVVDLDLTAKYSKFDIGNANNLNITSSYTDKYKINTLKTLNISETKYGDYKIDELASSLFMEDGYSDKFTIAKTGSAYKGLSINGKYIKMQVSFDKGLDYRFKANVKYPKFDINEEAMSVRIKIKESSQLEMEAIKGIEKEGMPEFTIKGYDMAVTFTER